MTPGNNRSPATPGPRSVPNAVPFVAGANIDTLILNAHGKLPEGLLADLDTLKEASQEADDDVPTSWTFAGETLYIKAHGSGRQWRWILHCPSLHLDVGRGKLNGIVGKARLASACLWELGPEKALATLYAFLVAFYGAESFTLQLSEVHLCVDVAGWDLTLADAQAFVSRSRRRKGRLVQPGEQDDTDADDGGWEAPDVEVNSDGRLCTGFEFSKTAPHSCTLYDKTKELRRSRKDWMHAIWLQHGWDGVSRVIRVEFRYEREVLREFGVEDPFVFFDQLPGLWAYSTHHWLRHTLLTVPEAAKVLGISRSVFYELLLAGDIRSVKIGRARRVPFAVLEDFVSHRLAAMQEMQEEQRVG